MKKLTALFLTLMLLLTVCGQGMTAYAEDYEYEEEYGDGYDEWTEDDEWYDGEYDEAYMSAQGCSDEETGDGEYDEDEEYWDLDEMGVEPQIWLTEDEYDEELYEEYYGKKDVDNSTLPPEVEKNATLIKRTPKGTIVVGEDEDQFGWIRLYIDGKYVGRRDLEVSYDPYISDNLESYPDSRYWAYGFVGDYFIGIEGDVIQIIEKYCSEMINTDGNVYCYARSSGNYLFLSTLMYRRYKVGMHILSIRVEGDYTLIAKRDGTYVLNASPYAISHMSYKYFYEHPIPMVYLGNGSFSYYRAMLNQDETGESDEELAAKLYAEYGVDFSKWGNPRYDFKIEDIELMNGLGYQEVYDNYDIGEHDPYRTYLNLENISCGSYYGNLRYQFDKGGYKVESVRYEVPDCDEADFEEFRAYLQRASSIEGIETRLGYNATAGYRYIVNGRHVFLEYTEGSANKPGTVTIFAPY